MLLTYSIVAIIIEQITNYKTKNYGRKFKIIK